MFRSKKGEMGIGTLIIFIALLLVAAIAAGVLIQTSGSLQEKALTTGDQARGQIATNVRVVEVSATDGSNGTVKYFQQIIKLAPGSEPIKLEQVLLTMNSFDRTATLSYAGTGAGFTNDVSGYYTFDVETITHNGTTFLGGGNDYDLDGTPDTYQGGLEGANAFLNLSFDSSTVLLGACAGGIWVDATPASNNYTKVTGGSCTADDNVTTVEVTPYNESEGVFAVEYLQQGSNFVEGNLQRGDVIKVYYEAPKNVGEDEKIRINFIPKIGTPTLTEFITPEVISVERVYLYP
ncbi:hypothetical protein H6504_00835 [Candidatus Woesearchaeota archaeon]|nr:hypothetical protein [Candidatus Woesearchaeota archaeon]